MKRIPAVVFFLLSGLATQAFGDVFADRVKETTTTTGTGTIDLAGAVSGHEGFVTAGLTGANIPYVIESGSAWEIGLGTITDASPDTLARDTILQSSNGDALVSLTGTSTVFNGLPASRISIRLIPTATKTSGYTAVSGDRVIANGSFEVTLPATPDEGARVGVFMLSDGTVTIGRNSSNINSTTDESPYTLLRAGDYVEFMYSGTTPGWMPVITNFSGEVQAAITAAGSTQGAATLLTGTTCEVTTITATSADGVRLPSITAAGDTITVINNHASVALALWPATSDNIDGTGVDSEYAIAAGDAVTLVALDLTNWDLIVKSSGGVSKTGTPVDGQIAIFTDATTIEGDAAFTFDDTDDTLVIGASGKLGFGAVDILSDSAGTTTLSNVDAIDATTEATVEAAIDTLANLTAASSLVTVGTLTSGNADAIVTAASDSVAGKVELATGAETNTGTANNLAVTPDGLDDWTGSAQITNVGTLVTGNVDGAVSQASDSVIGKVELATSAETNTGTANNLAVTPDGLDDWTGSAQVVTVGAATAASLTVTGAAQFDDGAHFGTVIPNVVGGGGTSVTIDLSAANHQTLDLEAATGTVTLTLDAADGTAAGVIIILQDGTAARDITFADGTGVGVIVWLGTEPTWTDVPVDDYIAFSWIFDGTNVYLSPSGIESARVGS